METTKDCGCKWYISVVDKKPIKKKLYCFNHVQIRKRLRVIDGGLSDTQQRNEVGV